MLDMYKAVKWQVFTRRSSSRLYVQGSQVVGFYVQGGQATGLYVQGSQATYV